MAAERPHERLGRRTPQRNRQQRTNRRSNKNNNTPDRDNDRDRQRDADGDGLGAATERGLGSDLLDSDTDDGLSDGDEVTLYRIERAAHSLTRSVSQELRTPDERE